MKLKEFFPIFKNYPHLVFVDNASTSQKPFVLIESLKEYYELYNSNVGRGIYELAEKSQKFFEESKKNIANFIGTNSENLIFTSGATESMNMIAYFINQLIPSGSKILISIYEHHSNLLVWQRLAQEKNLILEFIKDNEILLNPEILNSDFFHNVSLLVLTHVSNVNGEIFPISKWINICKKYNIISVIDGSQGITSEIIDLKNIQPDFYSFSAHKIYGPMGLGITYFSKKYFTLNPYKLGGGIIEDVEEQNFQLSNEINRFEAGTPNIANIYAFSKVLTFLSSLNWEKCISYTHELNEYFYSKLKKLHFVSIVESHNKGNLTSFNIKGIHPHDVGTFLSTKNIAVRVGKHCAYPLHYHLNLNSSVRVSFAIYNSKEEIDYIIQTITQCYHYFNKD
jgi:cysteine desulfurase/selenocysteine lyase